MVIVLSNRLCVFNYLQRLFFVLQIILNPMCKYQPRIHIIKCNNDQPCAAALQHFKRNSDSFSTHIFDETQFMGVTAYQNQQVPLIIELTSIPVRIGHNYVTSSPVLTFS